MSFDDLKHGAIGGSAGAPPEVADPRQALLELALARSSDAGPDARVGPLARRMLAELDPQGPAETMLVVQMIATFVRSMFLARNANRQKNTRWFALYSGECDRAMDLYRKQMRALDDHRNPRPSVFTAIRNANINANINANVAGQQVVVTGPLPAGSPADRELPDAEVRDA